jgi:hypothetical protein
LGTLSIRVLAWGIILANCDEKAPTATLVLLVLACLSLTTVTLQQQAAGRLGLRDDLLSYLGQMVYALLKPLIDLFHWTVIVASCRSHSVRWGHVRYRIHAQNCIRVTERTPWISL